MKVEKEIPNALNEFGKLVFRNKHDNFLFAERAYSWVDRVVLIDEGNKNCDREVVGDLKFSDLT